MDWLTYVGLGTAILGAFGSVGAAFYLRRDHLDRREDEGPYFDFVTYGHGKDGTRRIQLRITNGTSRIVRGLNVEVRRPKGAQLAVTAGPQGELGAFARKVSPVWECAPAGVDRRSRMVSFPGDHDEAWVVLGLSAPDGWTDGEVRLVVEYGVMKSRMMKRSFTIVRSLRWPASKA